MKWEAHHVLEDLQAVRTLYRDEGFANVLADPETTLDPDRQEVVFFVVESYRTVV